MLLGLTVHGPLGVPVCSAGRIGTGTPPRVGGTLEQAVCG